MGLAMEVISGRVVAPSTTYTAWTLSSGNSLTIRNANLSSKVRLLQAWTDQQTAGRLRIRSPKLHDNVQNMLFYSTASDVKPLMPWGSQVMLFPQDTLTVEQTGSATCGDIESGALLVYYDDLPGQAARLMAPAQIAQKMVNLVTVENTLALGTAGGYSGEEAINAETDYLKANTEYALLGGYTGVECLLIGYRGVDTGNLRVAIPGDDTTHHLYSDWFVRLSEEYGLPCIPVFNSANRAGILLDGVQDENGADAIVTSIFAELR